MHAPTHSSRPLTSATTRTTHLVLTAALLLAGCNAAGSLEEPDNTRPTPANTRTRQPDAQPLDDDTAAQLYVAWRQTVYALPLTQPQAVDIEAAGDGIVVPDSQASDWITQELQLARDRGVIVRGTVHAEAIPPIQVIGDRASATICSSADVHLTDLVTGDPVSHQPVDTTYTPYDTSYRRIGDRWMVKAPDRSEQRHCVPPSIEEAVTTAWEVYAEAWLDVERRGGGPDIGSLADVVTERFATTLRGFPPHDPVPNPPPFTDLEVTTANRTTVHGHACRSNQLQNVEWVLVDGQWRIDFVGQTSQEPVACP